MQEYLVLLDPYDPRNSGRRLFSSWSLASNCHSLIPLEFCIMNFIALICIVNALLGNKYFRSTFLISSRWLAVVPPKVATIQTYSGSVSPRSKVFRKTIFPTVDDFPVPITYLSKFVRSCKVYYGGPYSKVPILNS